VPYLAKDVDGKSKFEKKITRSRVHYQSLRLSSLVRDVNVFLDTDDESTKRNALTTVVKDFDAWRVGDPKEFAERFADGAPDFMQELHELNAAPSLTCTYDEGKHTFPTPPATASNRHRYKARWKGGEIQWGKEPRHYSKHERHDQEVKEKVWEGLEKGTEAGELAVSIAGAVGEHAAAAEEFGKVIAGIAAKVVGVAAPAAGHLGMAAAGLSGAGALAQVATSIIAGVSAYKTHDHRLLLDKLDFLVNRAPVAGAAAEVLNRLNECRPVIEGAPDYSLGEPTDESRAVHKIVGHHVLPYIVNQKYYKEGFKIATASMVGALPVSIWCMGKRCSKWLAGTVGVERYKGAHWLAYHFCVCDCQLAMSIVAYLTSPDEMYWLLQSGEYEDIAGFLAEKMKAI